MGIAISKELKKCCTCKIDKEVSNFTPGEWKKSSTKRCRDCIKLKNEYTSSRNKEARSKYQKQYYAENREKLKHQNNLRYVENKDRYSASAKKWYVENKDKINQGRKDNKDQLSYNSWVYRLKRVYGLTPEDYLEMLSGQNFSCAICKTTNPGSVGGKDAARKVFAVDHCHESGKIRGLLCHRCNTGLGLFYDNQEALLQASEYIKDCH